MQKLLLSLSLALCCVVLSNNTTKAMMSQSEYDDARLKTSRCATGSYSYHGHKLIKLDHSGLQLRQAHPSYVQFHPEKGDLSGCSYCLACDALHKQMQAHNAATAKKSSSDEEEAELRKQLLRAQIAALQGSSGAASTKPAAKPAGKK